LFRNNITKRAAGLVVALLSVLGVVVALGASPAAASGPFNACRNVYYADGAIKFAVCNDYYDDSPDSTHWKTYQRRVFNPSLAQGGHSDVIDYYCDFDQACGDYITDSNTEISPEDYVLLQTATSWIEVAGHYGASNWCHRVFFNHGGGTSLTGC
jgi:hypothetical protein